MKTFLKLSFVFMLIIVAVVSTCHTTYGSPIESSNTSSNRQVADEIRQEGALDLKRILNGTHPSTDEESNNNQDELDSVASANLLSILGDLDGAAELDLEGAHKQLLQPEGSRLLSMNLLPGKRRFDDNTALASTGQARGNRFIMPQVDEFKLPPVPPQLFNEPTLNTYATLNEALIDHPKFEQRSSPPKMMNGQRRSGGGGNIPSPDRRQLDIRPRAANKHAMMNGPAANPNYNNYLGQDRSYKSQPQHHQQQHNHQQRQESIKRPTKPRVELGHEQEQDADMPIKDSDIFKDEADERGGAEKRVAEAPGNGGAAAAANAAGDQADYDDNEEADEGAENQEIQNVGSMNARASSSASPKMHQQQQQHLQFNGRAAAAAHNPMQGIEDAAANAPGGDQDEDIDSTNLRAKKSRANVELTLQARPGGDNSVGNNPEEDGSKQLEKENEQKSLGPEQDDADEALAASQLDKSATDLQTAAGHHHGHSHGHYYQYAGVPKKKAWKFGFKRGNHKHTISREEKGYKNKFHSHFKWHAKEKCKKHHKCESVGKMSWHYEHHDKKKHHHY